MGPLQLRQQVVRPLSLLLAPGSATAASGEGKAQQLRRAGREEKAAGSEERELEPPGQGHRQP